jgi:SAM-dependent methyltransferase
LIGKTLSKSQREELDLNDEKSLIYGEVDYPSFYRILRKINAPKGSIFYDLGSGTGKAVFAARLTQDFKRCIGIEILSRLHMRAELIVNRFTNKYNTYLCYGGHHDVQVLNDSLIDYDWSDGDVVFANSTCFDDSLMQELSEKAELLKAGSIVITFTKGLTSRPRTFELLERKRYKMSWGYYMQHTNLLLLY